MIRVAVCDDEKIFLDNYIKIINNIKKSKNYNIEIHVFNTGEDLVKDIIINERQFELIFLDIIMGELNGIETAKKIKLINESTEIVFLTSSKEYALDGYEIRPLNYILKNADDIEYKMYKAIKHSYSKTKDYILIKNKSSIEKVEINRIVYIESNKRKIIINTDKSRYETYEKLDNIYDKIQKFGFIKTHRSYIINMDFIKKIDTKDIITTREEVIPISRGKVEEVKNKFMEYLDQID